MRDISTNQTWHFVCSKRVKPGKYADVATFNLKLSTSYSHMLRLKSLQSLRDHHIWLSAFVCPPHSTFTRVQRLSCGFALVMSVMLVNIMFYDNDSKIQEELLYDDIKLNTTQIIIGIQSILITLPLGLLTVFLFRHVTPRNVVFEVRLGDQKQADPSNKLTKHKKNQIYINKDGAKMSNSYILPWWFIYIAWALTISTCLVSSYVVLLYGLTFGFNKSVAWLTSFVTAATNNAAIFQPLKVAIIVIIVTLLFKKPVGPVADITPRVNIGRLLRS